MNSLTIFGDSLSDTGRFAQIVRAMDDRYWKNRFSNGPLWPELFSEACMIEYDANRNRAVGSACTFSWDFPTSVGHVRIPGLIEQIASLDSSFSLSDSLCVIWLGTADLMLYHLGLDTSELQTLINRALTIIEMGIDALRSRDARTIVVVTAYDVSRSHPNGIGQFSAAQIKLNTSALNAALRISLARFSVIIADMCAVIDNVFSNQLKFSITEELSAAGWADADFVNDRDWHAGERYATWDETHLTSKVHREIARAFDRLIATRTTEQVAAI